MICCQFLGMNSASAVNHKQQQEIHLHLRLHAMMVIVEKWRRVACAWSLYTHSTHTLMIADKFRIFHCFGAQLKKTEREVKLIEMKWKNSPAWISESQAGNGNHPQRHRVHANNVFSSSCSYFILYKTIISHSQPFWSYDFSRACMWAGAHWIRAPQRQQHSHLALLAWEFSLCEL